jgi:hypothetical protein
MLPGTRSIPIRRVAVLARASWAVASPLIVPMPASLLLLDIVPPKLSGRTNRRPSGMGCGGGAGELKKAKPAAFMHARNAALVSIAFDDDLGRVAEADLIVGDRQAAGHQATLFELEAGGAACGDRVEHVGAADRRHGRGAQPGFRRTS